MKKNTGYRIQASGGPWAKMDALRGPAKLQEKPEGTFTATEFAERYGITHSTALNQIRGFVRRGVLLVVGRMPGQGSPRVYRVAD